MRDQTEKLLIGIENVLGIAADLVDEVSRLKEVEAEHQMLKEKFHLFFSYCFCCEWRRSVEAKA